MVTQLLLQPWVNVLYFAEQSHCLKKLVHNLCNLCVPIPNEQTSVTRYVLLSYYKVFLIWILDSSLGHMHNYTPATCCYVTGTSEIFILSSFLVWWLSFTIVLTTYLIVIVTQLPWQKYDMSIPPKDVPSPFCPKEQPHLT